MVYLYFKYYGNWDNITKIIETAPVQCFSHLGGYLGRRERGMREREDERIRGWGNEGMRGRLQQNAPLGFKPLHVGTIVIYLCVSV